MKGTPLARRHAGLGQRRLVLFEDRVEERLLSVFGLEVRQLFFDELECATLRPQRQAHEIVLAALGVLAGVLVMVIGLAASQRAVGVAGFLLALVAAALLLVVVFWTPWQLVLRAGSQEFRSLLPRREPARQRALRLLVDGVRLHQRRHAPPAPAAPAAEPAVQATEEPAGP